MYTEQILLGLLAAINIIAFFVMVVDKRKSIRGGNVERIPEGLIFFMATMLGGIGVYAGMPFATKLKNGISSLVFLS